MAPRDWPQLILEGGFSSGDPVQPAGTFVLDDAVNGVLGTGTLGDGVTWSDLSPWVRSGSVIRPASREQGPLWSYQPGTASVALANADGRFDPDNLSGPYVTPAVPGVRTGVYMNQGQFQQADWTGLASLWQAWSGKAHSGGVTRCYAGTDYSYSTNLQEMVAAGTRIALSFTPAYNPPSSADLASITSLLATLKAAGADVIATVWHEPKNGGLTAAQYVAAVQFYAPAMRQYFPFWSCFSGGIDTIEANGYYPGDAYTDGIAVDVYLTGGFNFSNNDLTNTAAMADNHGKPLGIWEFGTTSGTNFFTGDNHTFAAGTGTWVPGSNCSAFHSTVTNPFGTQTGALGFSATAAGDMRVTSAAAANYATQMQACSPGDEITVGAWAQAATVSRTCTAGASFFTSGGVFVSTVLSADPSATGTDPAGSWAPLTGKLTAPATAAWFAETVQVQGAAAGETHRLGMAFLSDSTTQGHTQAGSTTWWQWVQSYMLARAQSGQPNGDVILFNAGMPGNSNMDAIQYSNDYRVGLWLAMKAALDGLGGAAAASRLSPMVPVRVRAVWDGTPYPLFSGFADSWGDDGRNYAGRYAETALSATDAQKVLNGITLPPAGAAGSGETSGARVSRILDAAGWYTGTRLRQVAAGESTVQAYAGGGTAWALMQAAADSEIGELYADGSGALVFRDRHAILTEARSGTVQAVFGDNPGTVQADGTELPYTSVTRARDDATLANDIQAARTGGTMQEVQDTASIAKYLFPRTYPRSDLILQDDTTVLLWAQWVLYVSRADEDRFDSLTVNPLRDPVNLWPQVLGRQPGDRIQVWRRPPGAPGPVVKDCFIRGIAHAWDWGAGTWQTTWTLQDASKYGSFFTLGNPELGQLDANALTY